MANERLPFGRMLGLRTTERPAGTPTRTENDPTQEEAAAANTGAYKGSTKTVERVGGNKLLMIGLVTPVVGAAGYGIYGTVPAVHERIDSFRNTFNPADGQRLVDTRVENSNPNFVIAKKFDETPPSRVPSENISSQNIAIDQLPTIKQHTEYAEGGNYDNFDPGINFRIKEQPPVPYTYKNVTPNGLEPHTIMMDQPSFIRINGYVIRKEVGPEGNILLAVEVPGKNGLFNQNDIDKSLLSTETFTDNRHYDKISGAIVWLKIENFEGYSWPFGFSSSWNATSLAKRESNKITNIPGELLKYLRVGDPMSAIAQPGLTAWDEENLANNYKNQKNHLTYEQAREKYSNIVDSNAKTIQRMLEDAKTGSVSLKEQLENKRYALQVREANFVPRD